jgi:tripartite-type tricarboxylate transporter receptor subunit TctC
VQQSLSDQGLVYRLSTPEAFGRFLADEIARWAKVIKDNKIVVAE